MLYLAWLYSKIASPTHKMTQKGDFSRKNVESVPDLTSILPRGVHFDSTDPHATRSMRISDSVLMTLCPYMPLETRYRALLHILSKEGRGAGLCWAHSQPKGPHLMTTL